MEQEQTYATLDEACAAYEDETGERATCWRCEGEGWLLVGCDIDEDWEEGWGMGDAIKCPCCHGSGNAKDCTYW